MKFDDIEFNLPDIACLTVPGRRILVQTKDNKYQIYEFDKFTTLSKVGIIRWADCPTCLLSNREKLIVDLIKDFPELSVKQIKSAFDDIYEYDYKCFCSQMGDYDHPSERRDAMVEWEQKFHDKYQDNPKIHDLFQYLTIRNDSLVFSFYHAHFHSLTEVYTGE